MSGTTLSAEYAKAAGTYGLGAGELADLAANAVRASFLEDAAKKALLDEIAKC